MEKWVRWDWKQWENCLKLSHFSPIFLLILSIQTFFIISQNALLAISHNSPFRPSTGSPPKSSQSLGIHAFHQYTRWRGMVCPTTPGKGKASRGDEQPQSSYEDEVTSGYVGQNAPSSRLVLQRVWLLQATMRSDVVWWVSQHWCGIPPSPTKVCVLWVGIMKYVNV